MPLGLDWRLHRQSSPSGFTLHSSPAFGRPFATRQMGYNGPDSGWHDRSAWATPSETGAKVGRGLEERKWSSRAKWHW